MPKIKRVKPPLHNLILDTNALWHNDKSNVVSPDFQKFWDSFAEEFDLKLRLPEVVRGELLYQQTSSALTSLERANNQFESMSIISGVSYKHRLTSQRLTRDIENRFDKWMSQIGADLIPTPKESINWGSIINDAIWRNPPFIAEKDREKGFRDSLILETVLSQCKSMSTQDIVFVSGDRLLRDTATLRLEKYTNASVYESIEEFSAYLRLTKEKLTAEFVRLIQKRASLKFFDARKRSGLVISKKLSTHIRNEHTSHFRTPSELSDLAEIWATGKSNEWTSISDEGIWIGGARFDHLEGEDKFHWVSPITYVELFSRPSRAVGLLPSPPRLEEKLRILEFNVHWKTNVKADGRFYKLDVVSIDLDKHSFEIPTSQQLENFGIRRSNEKE